jgi:cation:H+ antiporter
VPQPVQLLAYGAAVVAAGFMLAWACETAQVEVANGLVVAVVAFVAILPEYVVEVHYAFTGRAEYVTANLTGASRLLLGFCIAMPAVIALLPARFRPQTLGRLELSPSHRLEIAVLGLGALWALRPTVRGELGLLDAAVLISLYVLYLRRASQNEGETPDLVGVPARLAELPRPERRRWTGGLMAFAALVILLTTVPFADAVLGTGAMVGISPYLLLQWLVPVATETPELVVAFVLLSHARGGEAIALLLASAVSQYTLALGTLPVAYLVGAGAPGGLPLASREQVEMFLTVAVALYAVGALVRLRLSRGDASIMLILFALQFFLPTVISRFVLGLVFAVVAVDILVSERRQLKSLASALRTSKT